MEYKKYDKTYVLRLNKGEEIISSLLSFANKEQIKLAKIEAIGATNYFTVGVFNAETKEYHKNTFEGAFEITSLLGNLTLKDKEPYLHLHLSCSKDDFSCVGGHLVEAYVCPTCEIFITEFDGEVSREHDEELGINLLSFE